LAPKDARNSNVCHRDVISIATGAIYQSPDDHPFVGREDLAALVRCLRQIAHSETARNRRNNGIMKRSKAADDGDAAGGGSA